MDILKMNKTLIYLLNLGTDKVVEQDKIYVRQANTNGLFFFFLDTILALIFFLCFNDLHLAMGLVVSGILFLVGSLGLNYLGKTTLSRLSTASIGSFLVAYCSFYLGPDSFISASLMLGAIFPFVYFSNKEKANIIICLSLPFIIYIILITTNYTWGPKKNDYTDSTLFWIRVIMFLIPYIGILANSWIAVAEREKKNDELYESKKLIETIFFALTHDLANPIQNISFISRQSSKPEDFTEARIKSLKSSTSYMIRIFNNLKDVVKFSIDGKIKMRPQLHKVLDVIKEATLFTEDLLKNKDVKISFDPNTFNQELKILVDKEIFIFQIISNFLTNSIKFSEPGDQIEITVKERASDIQIGIRDWGYGIEAEKLNKLFTWNERTTTLGTNGEKGSGLGLPLANKFLKDMNGSIEIQSFPKSLYPKTQQGTLVIITLPKL
jgi:signal transduction histidine kinase